MTVRDVVLSVGGSVLLVSLAGGCTGSMTSTGGASSEASLCEATFASSLAGRVVDEAGVAIAGTSVQACVTERDGRAFCLEPVESDARGAFVIEVPEDGRCFAEAMVRITRPGEAGRYATTYCAVEGAVENGALSLAYDATIIALPAALSLPPVGTASETRSVLFMDGIALSLSPEALVREDAYPLLRAKHVTTTEAPCSIGAPASVQFDGLVAFGPEVELDGDATLGLPIDAPEGSRVELFTIGGTYTLLEGAQIPEGRFARVATSVVRSGRVSVTGLPILSWVGYRVLDEAAATPTEPTVPASAGGGATPSANIDLPAQGSCPAIASGRDVGDVIAELSFPNADGSTFAVRDHCEDELVVVYHYVDGCGSCAAFLASEGNALAAEVEARGYRFVVAVARVNDLDGTSREPTIEDARRLRDELGLTMPVVVDDSRALLSAFSRSGPSYVLFLRRGNVIAHPWAGYGSRVSATVRDVMSALEAE